MKKGKLIGKIFGVALVFVMIMGGLASMPALVTEVKASPGTIYVPDDYPTIQAALDAASLGNTIAVISTIEVGEAGGADPWDIAVNPATNRIYTANLGSNSVAVIDGATDSLIATISLPIGSGPYGITVNPNTNYVYVANWGSDTVSVIDGATNSVVATVPVGNMPSGAAVNPVTNRIYVTNWWSDDVSVIDGATNSVVATVPVGSQPEGAAVNPVRNRIYVANHADNYVSVIDGLTNAVIAGIGLGTGSNPREVGVNLVTNRIYVANYGSKSVSVIDMATNSVMTTVPVGIWAWGVGVNPTTNRICVSDEGGSSVSVIDGATNSVVATVPVGLEPVGVAVNPTTSRIYVANSYDDTVSVIEDLGTALAVSSVSPEDGAADVSVDAVVTATFNEAIDETTIDETSFTLAGSAVSGTVTYNPATYTATFTPDANLDYAHEYTATLSTAITDLAGNPLAEAYTWSFTTQIAIIQLWCPWKAGDYWKAGGDGNYYGEGYHTGNSYWAVDFNKRTADDQPQNDDNEPILAAANGWITKAEWSNTRGWYVTIKHEEDQQSETLYAHLKYDPKEIPGIAVGQYVTHGTEIGRCDNTPGEPYSYGSHLHFALYKNGVSVKPNPMSGQSLNEDENGKILLSDNTRVLENWIVASLCSPGELRVYDSQGRVTGLVGGEVKNDIPNSYYYESTITLLSPTDSYRYEVVGTGEGTYGLDIACIEGSEGTNFTATDIPTAPGTVHQYTIDWDALSRGEEGVTVDVDSDGDGITDYTVRGGNVLTGDEFILPSLGCFIATAAYGTPIAEEIQILREFRDKYLLTNPVGRLLVALYYRVSPPIAEFITEHPSLKPLVRVGLLPAVTLSTVAVNTTPVEKMAILGLLVLVSVALAVWATRRRGRGPERT